MEYNDFYKSRNFNPGTFCIRALMVYLRHMFLVNDQLGFKIYTPDLNQEDALNSLLITTKFDWENTFKSKVPALVIYRGNITRNALGTSNTAGVTQFDNVGDFTSYTDFISIPVMIDCIAGKDTESEVLCSIAQTFLEADKRVLKKIGIRIQPGTISSAPELFEKTNTRFISRLILQTGLEIKYGIKTINNEKLREVELSINNEIKSHIS